MALRFYTERIDGSRVTRTAGGHVRVDATVAKAGVYKYTRADGSVVREYLPPDEVTKADSLASLEDATVTHRHPGSMVDPSSWGQVSIGHARGARAHGDKAMATLVISRADAQSKIGTELVEVSRGVKVRVDETPGITPQGEHYDAVQRDVVYNHIAVGPRGWGRQGPEVSLRLDSAGDELIEQEPENGRSDTSAQDYPMKYTDPKTKIVHEFKSDAELSEFIAARVDAAGRHTMPDGSEMDDDEMPSKKKAKTDAAHAAELAAEKARADAAQAKLDAIENDRKVAARAALETRAKAVLGETYKADSKDTDRTIQLAALAKLTPAVKYDGKSDVYVESAFDIALSTATTAGQSRSDALAAALHGVGPGGLPISAVRTDADDDSRLDARERMIKRNAEAFKGSLKSA